ncbi:MAG: phosphoribosylglycinamide synthetase C domain-containing protein, partial [Planctomycetota bacterium]
REPGTVCRYASIETQALGLILRRATGQSVAEYMHTKLSEPLGMTAPGYWLTDARGHEMTYAGLMLTEQGPKVLEYNVRFGDPETQPILFRLKTDILELFEAATEEDGLARFTLDWDERPSVCVVTASGGYPDAYEKGKTIEGLADADALEGVKVFHAGTKLDGDQVVTSGGRVLGITAIADDRETARQNAYAGVERIQFEGMRFRTDIAAPATEQAL